MPRPGRTSGRHRKQPTAPSKTRKLGRVIVVQTIFVLLVGTIFVGGYLLVWYLLSMDRPSSLVGVLPETDFTPVNPSVPISAVNTDKECFDFFDQEDAQKYYIAQGGPFSDPDQLDVDGNGLACEDYNYIGSSSTSEVNGK